MKIALRRRLAVGVATAATVSVVGYVMAPAAYAGSISAVSPSFVFNNDPSRTLTFTTENPFPPNSSVTLTRVGDTADTISGSVNRDSFDPMHPTATINFLDTGSGAKDGPANPGQYSIKITQTTVGPVGTGTSDFCTPPACSFSVLPTEGLSVSGATPALAQGGSGNVTVTGTGFARSTKIAVLLPDGSVDPNVDPNGAPTETIENDPTTCDPPTFTCDVEIDDRTKSNSLLRKFTVKPAAIVGPRGLRVTNTDGSTSTCNACFTVNGAPLQSVSPTVGSNLNSATPTVRITFFGSGLTSGTPSLVFTGDAGSSTKNALTLTGTNVTFSASGDSVSADYDLRNAAPSSGYQPTLTLSNGVTNTCTCRFTVAQPSTANVTSVDPKNVAQSDSRTVTINGSNFSKGVKINMGAGITVTSVTFVSASQVRATIQVASTAATGDRDVQATTTDGRAGAICSKCVTVTASGSPSATPTASTSPSGSPAACPSAAVTLRINTPTINATGLASVTVTGAKSGARVELQGYSQNHYGTANFDNDPTPVDRAGNADSSGAITFNDLRPASNTRLRARQAGCSFGNSGVIEVRAQETLTVKRIGTRKYTFSGRSIPARPGGLIISLYRIVGSACAPGVEPSKCPGEKFVGQSRAAALGAPNEGLYSITITFPSSDSNVRDEFVVKTGRDAQNAPGRSNARSLLIY